MANTFTTNVPNGIKNLSATKQVVRGLDVDLTEATDGLTSTLTDDDIFLVGVGLAGGTESSQALTKKVKLSQLKTYNAGVTTMEALTDVALASNHTQTAGDLIIATSSTNHEIVNVDGDATLAADGTLTLKTQLDGTGAVNEPSVEYGSATAIPKLTVDAQGRITAITNENISTTFTLSDGSSTDSFATGETLTFTGGDSITTTVGANAITFDLDESISIETAITGTDTNKDLWTAVGGGATDRTINFGGAKSTVAFGGDFTVVGSATSINSSDFSVSDKNVVYATNTGGTDWGGGDGSAGQEGVDASILFATTDTAASGDTAKRKTMKIVCDYDGVNGWNSSNARAVLKFTHASNDDYATEADTSAAGEMAMINSAGMVFDGVEGASFYASGAVNTQTPTDGSVIFDGDNLYIYVA